MTDDPTANPDAMTRAEDDPAAAAVALIASFPRNPGAAEGREVAGALVSEALRIASVCEEREVGLEEAATLYTLAGRHALGAGDAEESKRLLERALALRERALGPAHPRVAEALTWLNGALQALGDRAGMIANARRVVEICEVALGARHAATVTHVNNLGSILRFSGELEAARVELTRAVALCEAVYGPAHPFLATMTGNLGETLLALGRPQEARACYERALAIDEAAYGTLNRSVARDLQRLGTLLASLGERQAAGAHLRRVLDFHRAELGPEHPFVADLEKEIDRLDDPPEAQVK